MVASTAGSAAEPRHGDRVHGARGGAGGEDAATRGRRLKRSGYAHLLSYMLQQIQQFRHLGEDFAMQHKDSEYLGELEEELQTAVLEAIPAERRLRGLSPEEVVASLSEEQLARLRDLLERKRGNGT